MIGKPTLVVHTTSFQVPGGSARERTLACELGEELYALLTRPKDEPLAWGAGIPVRVATAPERIDIGEAQHVVVVVILGSGSLQHEQTRQEVTARLKEWNSATGARVIPVLQAAGWQARLDFLSAVPAELYDTERGSRATLQAIFLGLARALSRSDAYTARLVISHAKADLEKTDRAAEKIRAYVAEDVAGNAFFDKVSILPGESLTQQLDREVGCSVFVAVRGDFYSSRAWCRRELLHAKQRRLPTLTVEVLSTGEARSATYLGNGPTVVWDRSSKLNPARVLLLAMVEAVRHLFFSREVERVASAAGLPEPIEWLSRPPELLDVAALKTRADARVVLLHPDPPLPAFECAVLQEADKRLRPITPTTAFAGAIGSSLRAPLDGWQVALSLSDLPTSREAPSLEGLVPEHLQDAMSFLARALIGVGAAVAYGGDFRPAGFTQLLSQIVVAYNESGRRDADFLHSYLGATIDPDAAPDLAFTVHSMRSWQGALTPPVSGTEVSAHRTALHFSDMRRIMSGATQAHVVLGGATVPRTHDPKGYGGKYPGVVEEAWRTLESERPLYVVGGLGGAAAVVVDALEDDATPEAMRDEVWLGAPARAEFVTAFDADPDATALGVQMSMAQVASRIREHGRKHLASDAASYAWNGLSVEENRRLFRTRDVLTMAALVIKGLMVVSTRQARGKLRVELVEGDVAHATNLELLVFPTFQDIALDGAGAALDRLSGGSASTAHRRQRAVPAPPGVLGADFLYAADLGESVRVLQKPKQHVERAAHASAELIRQQGFTRVGLVTFLGNVAPDLGVVIAAMIEGLRSAADSAEFVWFERDPERAALVAQLLTDNVDVVLTRRAAPIPQLAPPAAGKSRTVLSIRHQNDELQVALLLQHANGLAPVVCTPLDGAARLQLTGSWTQAAPAELELVRRGGKIAQLLFGDGADEVLDVMRGSELVIMHDAVSGGIPYEALAWTLADVPTTPASANGMVRHLLVPHVPPQRAVPRPPRAGKLGVLLVVNPTQDLPGTEVEAKALDEILKVGPFTVSTLYREKATLKAVIDGMTAPEIDILHFAGHGFYCGTGPRDSGLNCADGELTIERMQELTGVPRLAFVNACQAGRLRAPVTAPEPPQAFAEFFLRAGVDAYLGTFWLVSDMAASKFAAHVYQGLADGLELGEAVVRGRRELQKGGNSDWANYLLYGHSAFRAVQAPTTPAIKAAVQPPLSPHQVPAPNARVQDSTIVASWTFPSHEAPDSFALAVVDSASGEPTPLKNAVRIDRREDWIDGKPGVTFVATVNLAEDAEGPWQLRPSYGAPIDVRSSAPAAAQNRGFPQQRPKTMAGQALSEEQKQARSLQRLLDQQPDGGRDVLRALQGQADPNELRAAIDVEAAGAARAIWPFGRPVKVDEAALQDFVAAHKLDAISAKDAESVQFQTREDWRRYVFAEGAIAFTRGERVNKPKWPALAEPSRAMTHPLRAGEFKDNQIELALFSDTGNGLHSSLAIAKQIVASKLPYAFHLGDVYYRGSEKEIHEYFELPLQNMFADTELFMITGNHEMYSLGEHFQNLIARKAHKHPARQRQCGEMFRLAGDGFQVIGIDTMFVGWQGGRLRIHDRADDGLNELLHGWLSERPNDLTILMSTNEPWDKGSKKLTPLYESLRKTIAGRVDMWFWGNVHYAALYEPWAFKDSGSPTRGMVSACIGHGGYPFYTEEKVGDLPDGVRCRWLERKSRFWPDLTIRPDVGANGWCKLKLVRGQDRWKVRLTFLDWVGRERLRANLERADGKSIAFTGVEESDAAAVGSELTWSAVPKRP